MTRPRLLDVFCGAGGAAVGYHRAGFAVTGVDINPQPNYPYTFIQAPQPPTRAATPPPQLRKLTPRIAPMSGVQLMGMPWATPKEIVLAVPPVYTEHIGHQLIGAAS